MGTALLSHSHGVTVIYVNVPSLLYVVVFLTLFDFSTTCVHIVPVV